MGLWNVGGSTGTASYEGVTAKGSSWGTHLALGLSVSLDFLDRSAALSAAEASGIRHSYVFGEWMRADLGRGGQMRVGSSTWVTGLALEF